MTAATPDYSRTESVDIDNFDDFKKLVCRDSDRLLSSLSLRQVVITYHDHEITYTGWIQYEDESSWGGSVPTSVEIAKFPGVTAFSVAWSIDDHTTAMILHNVTENETLTMGSTLPVTEWINLGYVPETFISSTRRRIAANHKKEQK